MNISNYIDHTLLKHDSSLKDVQKLCEEAMEHGFKAVCIPPYFVKEAYRILENNPVEVCTVVGFPYGYHATFVKVEELKRAIDEGAGEMDVVVNISAILSQDWNYVANDIESCTRATHLKGKTIKVILETGALDEATIKRLCDICLESGVNFIKTSTGVNSSGAQADMVKMLKDYVNGKALIKASGGIKTKAQALKMIESGASRIGTSSGVAIVSKEK